MHIDEVKVSVSQLKLGMYVCRLDRPWLDSPFPFQGFYLNDVDTIRRVQDLCEHVYVDVERSSDRVALIVARLKGSAKEAEPQKLPKREPVDHYSEQARKSKRRYRDYRVNGNETKKSWELQPGRGNRYRVTADTEKELAPARTALDTCIRTVQDSFETLRRNGELDADQIGQAVEGVVASMTRNPDAMIWLARLADADDYNYHHCINTSIWSVALGRQIGLPDEDLQLLGQGALCCDLGKAKLPAELLRRDAPLEPWQRQIVKLHVRYSLEILEGCRRKPDPAVLVMVAQHHERYDGSGYPSGLLRTQIDLYARVAAIADCFDAMINDRCYRHGVPISDAVREMYRDRGTQFQPELLEEFIHAIGLYPAGTLVELSTGGVGVVIGQSRVRRLRPRVMLLLDPEKNPLDHYPVLDLMKEEADNRGMPLHIVRDLRHGAHGLDPAEYFF